MGKKIQQSKIEYIRIDDLGVDPDYQRSLDTARADAIARDFDPMRLGTVVVSRRGKGSDVIVDGQTRCAGAQTAGYGGLEVRCEVFEGLSKQEEAGLFLKLNNGRKAVAALDKYKARLVAEEPIALEIEAIVRALKLRIGAGKRQHTISAIRAVESVHRRQRNLARSLSVLVGWAGDDPFVFHGDLIQSMSLFLAHYPEVDDARLVEQLAKQGPERIVNQIHRDRSLDRSVSLTEAACNRLLVHYNKRLKRKLPPYTRRRAMAEQAMVS